SRQLRRLLDRRLALGLLAFALVALPWYVWVGVDTRADFLRGFFLTHNVNRYLSPMEHHGGPVYYYAAVLVLGFAPWSVFLGLFSGDAGRALRSPEEEAPDGPRASVRFLCCWVAVYFGFFSLAGTKLPNSVLPAFAPVALLTGRFLDRWRNGALDLP